ncbi:hypothetical protein, conserved [Trypanosoma brucei gambiense DAL972]|uniref:Uncharacterized protein n=2 Tax=Trypanosoma brucei TaxID=5691 RepID=D0A796_TRYB9|nr:hypothetical protein, conserved [Trypanosoma brucei gambiense DAL972]RHW67156.1 hypothetical protein DPX39_000045700 [Trypanosoma brucei equiperdum]CBH17547.1 hypothetical protein, conserved [Trypanosoma brucei gambiense DAL972]|eukprot:XP_011779811.1 hypothetical protein, conserved [Trypanosoma brucei gambiense DAL972]
MATARSYFYYLDAHGNLFPVTDIKGLIDGTNIPAGPIQLRDRAFLDFFYLRLKRSDVEDAAACSNVSGRREEGELLLHSGAKLTPQEVVQHFPYVSICGPERNFLKAEEAPLVFVNYTFGHPKCKQQNGTLAFGESLWEDFQPQALVVTREGKLFHPITKLKNLIATQNGAGDAVPRGLVEAQVVKKLGLELVCDSAKSGYYVLEWKGQKQRIPYFDEL